MNLDELRAWVSANFWKQDQVAGWAKRTFFERSVHRSTSDGAASGGLPVITGSDGQIDTSFLDENVVLLTTDQTVDGVKTFIDRPQIKISGAYAGAEFLRDQASVTDGIVLMRLEALANDTQFGGNKILARIEAVARETHTGSTAQTDLVFYATSTGTTTLSEVMRFTNGALVLSGGEQSYTPAITGDTNPTVAYTSRYGSYRLLNKGCLVQGQIIINTVSSGSGSARFSLPATSHASGGQTISAMWWDASGAKQPCILYIEASASVGRIVVPAGGELAATSLGNSDQINFGGYYLTA